MADEQTQNQTSGTASNKPSFLLVRIRPFNPKAGNKVRTYTYQGVRYREEQGWYRVPYAQAQLLKDCLQDEDDPLSQNVFDVLPEDQALALEEQEAARRERASAARPNNAPSMRANDPRRKVSEAQGVLTTADLRQEPTALTGGNVAPNDEYPPNGYPPARVYPQPTPGGARANHSARSEEVDVDGLQQAAEAGVDDKSLGVASANIMRDQDGASPNVLKAVQQTEDFGPDNLEGRGTGEEDDDELSPASPPSGKRKHKR
jgi:hypothetical protein